MRSHSSAQATSRIFVAASPSTTFRPIVDTRPLPPSDDSKKRIQVEHRFTDHPVDFPAIDSVAGEAGFVEHLPGLVFIRHMKSQQIRGAFLGQRDSKVQSD